eukprot:5083466-Pyramimonas_sp.AAC.1
MDQDVIADTQPAEKSQLDQATVDNPGATQPLASQQEAQPRQSEGVIVAPPVEPVVQPWRPVRSGSAIATPASTAPQSRPIETASTPSVAHPFPPVVGNE